MGVYRRLEAQLKPVDYKSDIEPTWCAGCGDFTVISSLTKVFSELRIPPESIVQVSGIGCSSRAPLFMRTYATHTLHGRAIPFAIGVKLANPELTVICNVGDGDLFSIGAGHNPHAARRNIDITVICMDNQVYGLTKNQVSPTSREGLYGSLTPYGNIDRPINPVAQMLSFGATFVAQTFSGNPKHMTEVFKEAISHRGFAFVNVLSPCPTFNKVDTFKYYREKVKDVNSELPFLEYPLVKEKNINEEGHDPSDFKTALELALHDLDHYYNPNAPVPIGVFYRKEEETYEDRVSRVKERYKAVKEPTLELLQSFINACKPEAI
ncbi:2-oxoglutarate ferredoxin oxidoreductase subunit beta [Hydrogenivirga caldilitoris]|uniref:2-oxoglutarate ferredoxin oxidoreductase subunit beta n=1 Tax=Hydrogenivirga caldilitoris TaxID=246264 RepID=A0A497XQ69_9AQUI|nr:2-oxoacid:ferredoxin oxidoreductase subunit beta [Hydrogenivirga caldilitoris]RLJ70404.1 2-oxoglutarate ferredoxin oxidoreductase subunit beta [Hydrogenivirga caldilitoris]